MGACSRHSHQQPDPWTHHWNALSKGPLPPCERPPLASASDRRRPIAPYIPCWFQTALPTPATSRSSPCHRSQLHELPASAGALTVRNLSGGRESPQHRMRVIAGSWYWCLVNAGGERLPADVGSCWLADTAAEIVT